MGSGQLGGLALSLCEAQFSIAQDLKGAQCRHIQDTSLEVERNWESGQNSKKKPISALLFMQMCAQSLNYSL